jgi:ATP-dependent helicase/nuclease subunit B
MTFIAGTSESDLSLQPEHWAWGPEGQTDALWEQWARRLAEVLSEQRADPREALVVLPVGAVLSQARMAWTRAVGGWQPRIDTIAALAEDQAWAWQPAAEEAGAFPPLSMDPVLDRLQAARALGQEAWGQQWARRDRRGFEFALDQIVAAAHAWARRQQAMPPAERAAYGDEAREALQASAKAGQFAQGPGGRERVLLAWALEWALQAGQTGWASDLLYLRRPSAWVGVTAGEQVSPGTEAALMLAVLRHAKAQGQAVWWCAAMPAWTGGHESGRAPVLVACGDAEDEAQQATAQVLQAVNAARAAGGAPVALIALDRSLIRRARALLEGAGATVADETGWRLSTTRAATVVTRLIQASHPRASTDELLDWLKSGWLQGPEGLGPASGFASGVLEAWCRRRGLMSAWGLLPAAAGATEATSGAPSWVVPPPAETLLRWATVVATPLQTLWQQARASLREWLRATRAALEAGGAATQLLSDPAGELAWSALKLDQVDEGEGGAWVPLSQGTMLDGQGFLRWVNAVLEATTFRPAAPEGSVDVVITPLARAVLRPFHAIVLPGADERQLGALGSASGWLSAGLCEQMGLGTPMSLRAAQWEAFALLMSRPDVVCLYRQGQGSEPLEPSAWLERWAGLSGTAVTARLDARPERAVDLAPSTPPMPQLTGAPLGLPASISATSYEQLRQCPYRFFAATLLRLRDVDELEEGLDRSDFGNWLHEVLKLFHDRRGMQTALSDEAQDVAAWLDAATEVCRSTGMDRDGQRPWFLPFQAGLPRLAQAYVRWLRPHEAEGWSVRDTEVKRERGLDLGAGLQLSLQGQLDRVDVQHRQGQETRFVLDYKTGSLGTLKDKVKQPLEDTQLAFYAALDLGDATAPADAKLQAAYLHLEPKAVTLLAQDEVMDAAQALVEGLSDDWRRLHAGAAMPALGEGVACSWCQARGLCRKDHWPPHRQTDAAPTEEGPTA